MSERYRVTWASDEDNLEKQLNMWSGKLVTILWRPAHRDPSGERKPGFIVVWDTKPEPVPVIPAEYPELLLPDWFQRLIYRQGQ